MTSMRPHPAGAPLVEPALDASAATAPEQPRWWSLDENLLPIVSNLCRKGQNFVLATVTEAEGGPRPAGTQMVLTQDHGWGSLSGGCIEADLARHARATLAHGVPRRLVYGRGSPWLDIRLACGGRLEILLELVSPDDRALAELLSLAGRRDVARYVSDGRRRLCRPARQEIPGHWPADVLHVPCQRLLVVGLDPFAQAIAAAGRHLSWEVRQVSDLAGPQHAEGWELDPWTAVAVASHDVERDHAALSFALRSRAGYVGVLGSRRRLPAQLKRLRDSAIDDAALARLRAPIGIALGAASPRAIGIAVVAEILHDRTWAGP
jgi:xanthine dehydrogenase accessory factor